LRLALEAADPDVHARILFADKTAENHHAMLDLKGNDLLLHALDPVRLLARPDVVLAALEEHARLLSAGASRAPPATVAYRRRRRIARAPAVQREACSGRARYELVGGRRPGRREGSMCAAPPAFAFKECYVR